MSLLRREMIDVIYKHILEFTSTSTKQLEHVVYIGVSKSGSEIFSSTLLPLFY